MPDPAEAISSQLRAIVVAATATLGTYTAIVTSLPVADLYLEVLPPAGPYQPLAVSLGILVSALLAYREFRHEAPAISVERKDVRRSGVPFVAGGALLTLAYIALVEAEPFGEFVDLALAGTYGLIVVSFSFGYVLIAMRAWDSTQRKVRAQQNLADMRLRTAELTEQAEQLEAQRKGKRYNKPKSQPIAETRVVNQDIAFRKFSTRFFIALTVTVTALASLVEALSLLPSIVNYAAVTTALSAIVGVAIIGASYASIYLEDNLNVQLSRGVKDMERIAQGKGPMIDVGLRWTIPGVVCIALIVFLDIWLNHQPPDDLLIELFVVALHVATFAFITYGIWRFAVDAYGARTRPGR